METQVVGPFEIIREIGSGGMGRVHEARTTGNGSTPERVAVKVLHPHRVARRGAIERFRREVEVLRRVSHPGIVPVLAADLEADPPWLAMPFVEGRTLDDLVFGVSRRDPDRSAFLTRRVAELRAIAPEDLRHDHPAWVAFIVRVGFEVAQALGAAHGAGIVHRDLKPGNIMIRADGSACLLDFGLVHDEHGAAVTLSHERLGTPLYMSPEQVGGGDVDRRSDIYSFGLTLREALTLRAPLSSPDLASLYRAIRRTEPRALRPDNPAVSPALARVLEACVRKDPRDRYADAAALARDFGHLLRGQDPESVPAEAWRRRVWRTALAAPRRAALASGGLVVLVLLVILAGRGAGRTARPPDHGSPLAAIAEGRAAATAGRLDAAAGAFAAALRRAPGDPDAMAGLASAVSAAARRAVASELEYRFAASASDGALVERWAPGTFGPDRVATLSSPPYRRLEEAAREVLDPAGDAVLRARALARLAEESPEDVPPAERDRLLLQVIGRADEDEAVLAEALIGLRRTRAPDAAAPVLALLEGGARPVRVLAEAVKVLAAVRHGPARPALEALAARDDGAGDEAVRALGVLGAPEALPALVAVVERGDRRAALAVASIGGLDLARAAPGAAAEAHAALVRAFGSLADPASREAVVLALGRFPEGRASAFLLGVLQAAEAGPLRAAAAAALGRSAPRVAERALIEALAGDRAKSVRAAAALALRDSGPRGEAALLRAAESDPAGEVRARAMMALGHGRVAAALETALRSLRDSEDLFSRGGAVLFLGMLRRPDPEVLALLADLLRRDGVPDEERRAAAWALGRIEDPAVLPALLEALRLESARARTAEAFREHLAQAGSAVLMLLADPEVAGLKALAGDLPRIADPREAATVGEALVLAIERRAGGGSAPSLAAVPEALIAAAGEEHLPRLRLAAIHALGRLGLRREAVIPVLEAAARTENRHEIRRALLLALVRLGRGDAAEDLLREPGRGPEDSLARGLVLLRLGRRSEAREQLLAAARAGVLTADRAAAEPELIGLRALFGAWAGVLGL